MPRSKQTSKTENSTNEKLLSKTFTKKTYSIKKTSTSIAESSTCLRKTTKKLFQT